MALRVLYGNAMLLGLLLVVEALAAQGLVAAEAADPSPTPWPEQFHAQIHQNTSGKLSTIELWYDWPNGRNLNIIQEQLGVLLYDLEWTNGTSYVYYYDLAAESCFSIKFPVGILRPDWLVDDSHYLGVREVDGFSCHAWEKADFITYYEDVASKRPVHWLFFNGMSQHVITFEEGKVLEDKHWQAPSYCFDDTAEREPTEQSVLSSGLHSSLQPWTRHSSNLAMSSPR